MKTINPIFKYSLFCTKIEVLCLLYLSYSCAYVAAIIQTYMATCGVFNWVHGLECVSPNYYFVLWYSVGMTSSHGFKNMEIIDFMCLNFYFLGKLWPQSGSLYIIVRVFQTQFGKYYYVYNIRLMSVIPKSNNFWVVYLVSYFCFRSFAFHAHDC